MAYQFDLPPRPDQLQAIGMVAVEWSYLESLLDAAIGNLASIHDEDALAAVTAHLNVSVRLNMLATLFHLDCQNDEQHGHRPVVEIEARRSTFSDVWRRMDRLNVERNRIVHARWVTGSRGSPMTYVVRARGTVTRTKTGVPASEILGIAGRIAELSSEFSVLFGIDAEEGG